MIEIAPKHLKSGIFLPKGDYTMRTDDKFILDLAERVSALEQKATGKKRGEAPAIIARVGDIWVNRKTLRDYEIVSVEAIEDLVICTAKVDGGEVRINQDELETWFVKRVNAQVTNQSRTADVTVQQLRRIAGQLNELADRAVQLDDKKELRSLAQEIAANIIPHIRFIGVVK